MRIEDYAIIGDTQTAALVGRDGSIDWLCFPRFDSGACFSALLGKPENGRWLLAPRAGIKSVRRRYRDDSLVLEHEFTTEDGVVRVVDCMPIRGKAPDIVRVVEGVRGRVRMRTELVVRYDYGSVVPWVRRVDDRLQAVAGADALVLATPIRLHGEGLTSVAEFDVSEGERVPFTLTWFPSYEPAPESPDPFDAVDDTERWWREWAGKCRYEGEYREAVVRSLITLKALTYAPSGGIVAAATASLPEDLGGSRNWDYRYCWLRDATFTLDTMLRAGYREEAQAWRDWLLRAIAGDPAKLQIMYGITGERRLDERTLDWLDGYEGSKPVRVGNGAAGQLQLDVFGETIDMLHLARRHRIRGDDTAWSVERALLEFLESHWSDPDEGLWEIRGDRQQFVHSKVMTWVAFDRAVKGVDHFGLQGPRDRWQKIRDEIHADVLKRGFSEELGSFTQTYGSKRLDASLLLLPIVGFLPASDRRVRGTIEAIERGLTCDGFVYRYQTGEHGNIDGQPGHEGAFLACSFWMVDALTLLGRRSDARALFERLLEVRNDVGLLSEEYDVQNRRLIGNFPQAFSHVGLINSARNLVEPEGPASQRTHT
jgi:GH15 family glucan-1,4-alpha-glucosidase